MNAGFATPGAPALQAPAHHGQGQEGASQFLSFSLNGQAYAVPLGTVAEICPSLHLNVMPHMPKSVEGLLDLRGTVIPVINLRVRLSLPDIGIAPQNIIILDHEGERLGMLVDQVLSVVNTTPDQHSEAGPLLAGPEGPLVAGFILRPDGILVLLNLLALSVTHGSHVALHASHSHELEMRLEEDLHRLVSMAPPRDLLEAPRVIPQIEGAIAHSEQEMTKVIDRIEAMLANTDEAFKGIARLKQEARLGKLPEADRLIAEVEGAGQAMQDHVFETLNLLQFQDIARQKLERVLRHIQGMQGAVGQRFHA